MTMKKPMESEYELMARAAVERLGPEGIWLFARIQEFAGDRGWSLKDQAAHLDAVCCVVNGMIAGWIEPPGE